MKKHQINNSMDGGLRPNVMIGIPCMLHGGTEAQTLTLVRALSQVSNVTVTCYFEFDDGVASTFRNEGAQVITLSMSRQVSASYFVRRMRQFFHDTKPDLLHIQYMSPGLLPICAARLAGLRRIVATIHYPGTTHTMFSRVLVQIAALLCRRFICVSEAVEKSWFTDSSLFNPAIPSTANRRHLTIHNAVDTRRIAEALAGGSPVTTKSSLDIKSGPIVGTVARLSPEKGIDLLLVAFQSIIKRVPTARMIVVGDGDEWQTLHALAIQLGLEQSVVWTGRLPWDDTIRHMAIMDVVVLPSRFEGFGLTAAEAMACGKPIVAFAVDGLKEVVEHGITGLLIPPLDTSSMEKAIVSLLNDSHTRDRMSSAGRNRILGNFSAAAFACKQQALLSSVLHS